MYMYRIRNKSAIFILLFMIVFIMFLLSSCSKETPPRQDVLGNNQDNSTDIQKEEIEKPKIFYDFDLLYTFKNISLSDTDKVQTLVGQLQYAKELSIGRIESSAGTEASLRIDYRMNLTTGQEYKVNHTKMMADVVMLFTLLDDLNAVEYNLVQEDYGYGGVPITREQAETVLAADIESLGKTEEIFLSEMPKKIANLQWNPDVMSVITYKHIMGLAD